jgi:hypothetical protein
MYTVMIFKSFFFFGKYTVQCIIQVLSIQDQKCYQMVQDVLNTIPATLAGTPTDRRAHTKKMLMPVHEAKPAFATCTGSNIFCHCAGGKGVG